MELKTQWHRLDPATRRWLMDNPGCVILPRTISTIVARLADEPVLMDQHGAIQLSSEDVSFIRARIQSATAEEYRFFDAAQPGDTAQAENTESDHRD